MTGGGKDLKNQEKSYSYIFKYLKNLKYFAKQLSGFLSPQREDEWLNSRGSILIEFAVCMPILIILLFYIHDLVKIKRYYSQTEFVAQQMANMIQNISQKREENQKKITKEDLAYIHCLAWQTVYPGKTMFYTNFLTFSRYPLGHVPYTHIYYVKGEEDGKVSCVFRLAMSNTGGVTKPSDLISLDKVNVNKNNFSISKVRFLSNTQPSNIYPTLKINKGEVKIIIETLLVRNFTWTGGASEKSVLGLYIVNPRMSTNTDWRYFFNSVVIFTPKPGLFDEDGPQ